LVSTVVELNEYLMQNIKNMKILILLTLIAYSLADFNSYEEFLAKNKVKTVPHPPYSPDLAMCDFWLFSGLKHHLRGKFFETEEELDWEVTGYFSSKPENAWKEPFKMGRARMEPCIEAGGQYIN